MIVLPQKCERARSWASLRVDGELSELESALLDAHLGRCEPCRAFARGAEGVAAALASARLERPVQLALVVPRSRRLAIAVRTTVATCSVAAAAIAAVLVGLGGPNAATRTVRPVAMVTASDTPNELRVLRRPLLIESSHSIPLIRRDHGEF
jgi:predicted anti-sigma-YlaC factor YlaD